MIWYENKMKNVPIGLRDFYDFKYLWEEFCIKHDLDELWLDNNE